MYQTTDYERADLILQNRNVWTKSMIDERHRQFSDVSPQAGGAFDREKKMRNDVRSLSDFTLPEWVR